MINSAALKGPLKTRGGLTVVALGSHKLTTQDTWFWAVQFKIYCLHKEGHKKCQSAICHDCLIPTHSPPLLKKSMGSIFQNI